MDIDLTKLNQLLTIARTGNFSRAAEELRITQPALSRSVAAMEERFGFRIFERGRSGAAPTAVGARALEDAAALLRQARAVSHNLRLYGRGEAGSVAFGLGPLIASHALSRVAARMLAERPRLQMRCPVKSPDALLSDLLNGDLEMVFCDTGHIELGPEITVEPLGSVTLALIARAGHPLAAVPNLSLEDIGAYPIAHSEYQQATAFHARGPFSSGALFCDNYDILRQLVLTSDVLCISSLEMMAQGVEQGRLVRLSVAGLAPQRSEIAVLRLKAQECSPAARAVITCIAELLPAS